MFISFEGVILSDMKATTSKGFCLVDEHVYNIEAKLATYGAATRPAFTIVLPTSQAPFRAPNSSIPELILLASVVVCWSWFTIFLNVIVFNKWANNSGFDGYIVIRG